MNHLRRGSKAERLLPLVPVVILLVFAALNLGTVVTRHHTPWFSGGFGMHATYDSPLFRYFQVYALNADGTERRLKVKQPFVTSPLFQRPDPGLFIKFVTGELQRAAAPAVEASSFRVELWQFGYTYDDTALTTRLIMERTIEIERWRWQ